MDTLRADHLGCYGYARPTSPHLDRLAAEGTRFADCFAQANATHPSFTTLFTGCDPLHHGVVGHFGTRQPDPALPMLAERLAAAGYATAAVDTLGHWFERGFAQVERYAYDQGASGPLRTAAAVNERAIPLLRELGSGPFFLFLHYWDPHTPYLPPPPYDQRFVPPGRDGTSPRGDLSALERFAPLSAYMRGWTGDMPSLDYVAAQYDGEIAYLDEQLGLLLAELDRLGRTADTLVVLTGDHGESLTEHGIMFDHHGLYAPQLHVPLLLRLPGQVAAGRVVSGFARHVDVTPTLLDLAGLPAGVTDGQSLAPALEGDSYLPPGAVFACEASWQLKRAVRTEDWTLIEALEPDRYGTPPLELYDRRSDPSETRNLAEEQPDVRCQLQGLLAGWVREREAQTGQPDVLRAQGVTLHGLRAAGDDSPEALRQRVQESLRDAAGDQAADDALVEERLRNLGYL